MNALIVYESAWGNTKAVAEAVAAGRSSDDPPQVISVDRRGRRLEPFDGRVRHPCTPPELARCCEPQCGHEAASTRLTLVIDPESFCVDGYAGAMGLSPDMLTRLPVDSWMLPGVALVASNGVLPLVVAVSELRGRRWPRRFGHGVVGAVLLAWPVTETALFGYPLEGEPRWLRPGVAATGLMIVGLGLLLPWRGMRGPRCVLNDARAE